MSGSDRGYSITLSARANRASGTVTPIALAVLRLITSSNFVGCSTGQIGRHRAAQKARRESGSKVCQVIGGWTVADKATLLGPPSPLIHGWKAQCCNSFHNQWSIAVEHPGPWQYHGDQHFWR
jgi:hypothetical protein